MLTLILGENAPIEQVDQAIAQMMAMQEAAQEQAGQAAMQEQAEQEAQAQDEPSKEDMEMMALANGGV